MTARVDQLLHTFRERDAVSDEARLFRDRLRERGFSSTIYAVNADPAVAAEVEMVDRRRPLRADALLYHHATVADLGVRAAAAGGRTALLYHGITPSPLVRPYQPAFADLLEEGARVLRRIAPRFGRRFADSRFGADEFRSLTGCEAEVLPFCLDGRRFAAAPGERPPPAAARPPPIGRRKVGSPDRKCRIRHGLAPAGVLFFVGMCQRYVLPDQIAAEREFVPAVAWWRFEPRYNVGLTHFVPAVRMHAGQSEAVMLRWGLIPSWVEGDASTWRAPSVHAQRIDRSKSCRGAWQQGQRCILPMADSRRRMVVGAWLVARLAR